MQISLDKITIPESVEFIVIHWKQNWFRLYMHDHTQISWKGLEKETVSLWTKNLCDLIFAPRQSIKVLF